MVVTRLSTITTPRTSTAYLDGLRGLAALFVFNSHFVGGFTISLHERGFGQSGESYYFVSLPFIRVFESGGNAAVVLFFLISGYVLSIGHLRKIRNGQPLDRSLLSAIVRRPIRLYLPCLVVSLIHAMLLHIPGPLVLPLPWIKPQEGGLLAELVFFVKRSILYFNPFQVHDSNHFWYPYNIVMWTIPIELKGSMLVFAVVWLLSKLSLGTRPVMAAAAIFCTTAIMLLMCWKWSMACFLLGVLLAMLDTYDLDTQSLSKISSGRKTGMFYAMFLVGWYLLSQPAHMGDRRYSSETPGWLWLAKMIPPSYDDDLYFRFWQSWGAFLTIYALLRLPFLQRLLSSTPLLFLGDVSFMLYLVHMPIFRIFGDRLTGLLGGQVPPEVMGTFWEGSLPIPDIGPLGLSSRFLICLAIVLPLCLIVSKWLVQYLDKPILKLSRSITTRIGIDPKSNSSTTLLPTIK